MERRAAEGVDVAARGRLGERELARRRPGRERGGDGARAVGHVGPQVGQADGPLAGAGAAEAGPLGQLQLRGSRGPTRRRDPRPWSRRTGRRRRRRAAAAGCAPPRPGRRRATRPSGAMRARTSRGAEPRPTTTVRHGWVSRMPSCSRTAARDGAVRVAVEADELARPRLGPAAPSGTSPTAIASGSSTPAACAATAADAVSSPRRRLPGQTGCSSAAPVASTTSWAWSVHELDPPVVVRHPHDERRAAVDGDDLLAGSGIEHEHVAALGSERGELRPGRSHPGRPRRRRPTGGARPAQAGRGRRPGRAAAARRPPGAGAPPCRRVPASGTCGRTPPRRPRRRSSRSRRPGRASRRGRGARPARRTAQRDRVAGRERPAAAPSSSRVVTCASAGPAGRTPARAAGGPGSGGR